MTENVKWMANNFSLNMVIEQNNYSLNVCHLSELQFKIETKSAINRLSQMDICQELGLFPHKGNVAAEIGDIIYVAQYLDGDLTFRRITVCEDIQ